jgi:hypothetical protein
MTIIHRSNHTAHVARPRRTSVHRGAVAGRLAGGAVAAALLLGAPILATVTAAPAFASTTCNPFIQVCLPNPDAPLGPWVPWEATPANGGLSPAVPIQIEVENSPAATPPSPAEARDRAEARERGEEGIAFESE